MRKFSLRLIEAVKEIRAQFECRSYVQQICGSGAKFSGCLPRQLACPFKKSVMQWPELDNTAAPIAFEIC